MKALEGKKTKIAAGLMVAGAIGLFVAGEGERGLELLLAALGLFGIRDKLERALPETVQEKAEE